MFCTGCHGNKCFLLSNKFPCKPSCISIQQLYLYIIQTIAASFTSQQTSLPGIVTQPLPVFCSSDIISDVTGYTKYVRIHCTGLNILYMRTSHQRRSEDFICIMVVSRKEEKVHWHLCTWSCPQFMSSLITTLILWDISISSHVSEMCTCKDKFQFQYFNKSHITCRGTTTHSSSDAVNSSHLQYFVLTMKEWKVERNVINPIGNKTECPVT